jgi:hypothetical protein
LISADTGAVGVSERSFARSEGPEERKLRDVDHCRRKREGKEIGREGQAPEASRTGGTTGETRSGRGVEAQTGTTAGLFVARANEPDEAQILIFSMYMDES